MYLHLGQSTLIQERDILGIFDLDNELELWFSGLGQVTFEFSSNANVTEICRLISENML